MLNQEEKVVCGYTAGEEENYNHQSSRLDRVEPGNRIDQQYAQSCIK
jgi:hypothetical protein